MNVDWLGPYDGLVILRVGGLGLYHFDLRRLYDLPFGADVYEHLAKQPITSVEIGATQNLPNEMDLRFKISPGISGIHSINLNNV